MTVFYVASLGDEDLLAKAKAITPRIQSIRISGQEFSFNSDSALSESECQQLLALVSSVGFRLDQDGTQVTAPVAGKIVTSPNGTNWKIAVDNDGVLSTEPV